MTKDLSHYGYTHGTLAYVAPPSTSYPSYITLILEDHSPHNSTNARMICYLRSHYLDAATNALGKRVEIQGMLLRDKKTGEITMDGEKMAVIGERVGTPPVRLRKIDKMKTGRTSSIVCERAEKLFRETAKTKIAKDFSAILGPPTTSKQSSPPPTNDERQQAIYAAKRIREDPQMNINNTKQDIIKRRIGLIHTELNALEKKINNFFLAKPEPPKHTPFFISQWQKRAHTLALEKGFYDGELGEKTTLRIVSMLTLFHSEISEAVECVRHNQMVTTIEPDGKPTGLPSELADIILRVLDTAEWLGIDLEHEMSIKHEYNRTRPHKHGGKTL